MNTQQPGHLRRRAGGQHADSMAGFNGLTFGAGGGGGGGELGGSVVAAAGGIGAHHLGYDDPAEQLAALQREVGQLRRQNRALAAANDARQQAAVGVLADLMRDQHAPGAEQNDARQQLARLVLALLDSPPTAGDEQQAGAVDASVGAVDASPGVSSSAKTRVAAADDACSGDWDPAALAEVASCGRVAAGGWGGAAADKYAAESLRAIGHAPALAWQSCAAAEAEKYEDAEKREDGAVLGALAQSLLGGSGGGFEAAADSRFVLYSASAGVFQARTLDGLRAGDLSLADIVEASARGVALEQLDAERRGGGFEAAAHGAGGCFWLDAADATPEETASLARVFGIHPLTVEDIVGDEDARDKCESFAGYHLLVYRTIADGQEAQSVYEFNRGADGLATTAFAVVVKRRCVLTFHRGRLPHTANVIARLCAQPSSAITAAYIAYAIVDDITDALAPEMRAIELEVDAVDELVLILSTNEQADMLRRIGAARRNVLTLWRLLQGKPDVIRAFSKIMERQAAAAIACDDADDPRRKDPLLWPPPPPSSRFNGREKSTTTSALHSARPSTVDLPLLATAAAGSGRDVEAPVSADEVAHYLSDVYDHIVALLASSSHCDMVLSRAHSNYLARISLELGESTVETNLFASRWTVIGAILVPLNVVTGLWGMNVKVPGGEREDLRNFFLILSGCMAFVIAVIVWARYKKIF